MGKKARRKKRGGEDWDFLRERGFSALFRIRAPGHIEPLPTEETLWDTMRLLHGIEFGSQEEVNAFLQKAVSGEKPVRPMPAGPAERAREITYRAWEKRGDERRRLTERALALFPDCVEAHTLLGLSSQGEEALVHLREAVRLAEKTLDGAPEGDLYDLVEHRPYLRAAVALAMRPGATEPEEALSLLRGLLARNPGDRMGARYHLLRLPLHLERAAEAEELLGQYPEEGTAEWAYSRLYAAWLREGVSDRTRRLRSDALELNPYVPEFLANPPEASPDIVTPGDPDEAAAYAFFAAKLWQSRPEALAFLEMSESEPVMAEDFLPLLKWGAASWPLVAEAWKTLREGEPSALESNPLVEIVREHPEFHLLWDRLPHLSPFPLRETSLNPVLHILLHLVVRKQRAGVGFVEEAFDALLSAGGREHEVEHVLAWVLSTEVHRALEREEDFDAAGYRSRLEFLKDCAINFPESRDWENPSGTNPAPAEVAGRPRTVALSATGRRYR